MKTKFIYSLLVGFILLSASGCDKGVGEEEASDEVFTPAKIEVPALIVVLNWSDYREDDAGLWHDKVFNQSYNSVNRWYYHTTEANIELAPIDESSGIANDGVIVVEMGKAHPGGSNDTTFRDTELRAAITSQEVEKNVDFASLDLNNDGDISHDELQIIFIVAGGEQSYGDSARNSVWAHSWRFEDSEAPKVDGVNLMKDTGDAATSGVYSMFGSMHDVGHSNEHKATVGIMAHELGHSLFDLYDLYDTDGGSSGIGAYDIMSAGTWGQKAEDSYAGETPTQYSAYTRLYTKLDVDEVDITLSGTVTLKCSSMNFIKLLTSKPNEYFLLACRDTALRDSERAFNYFDRDFTDNRLFATLYHVDEDKEYNDEDGKQTESHHYKVAFIEKDNYIKMTSTEGIDAYFEDVYTVGDSISSSKTKLYSGRASGYTVEVTSQNDTTREMTFKITRGN